MNVNELREWVTERRGELRDIVEDLDAGEVEGAEKVADADRACAHLTVALGRFNSAIGALYPRREIGDGEVRDDDDDDDGAEVLS